MKKRLLAGLMTHQYKKLPVTVKMWMQFNVWKQLSGSELTCSVGVCINSDLGSARFVKKAWRVWSMSLHRQEPGSSARNWVLGNP